MEELVLEAHRHVSDRITVDVGKAWPGSEEDGKFTLANLVSVVAELLEQQPGIALMAQLSVTSGSFALDDNESRINTFLPLKPVVFRLCSQVIHVIEHDLVELADPRVKVAEWQYPRSVLNGSAASVVLAQTAQKSRLVRWLPLC